MGNALNEQSAVKRFESPRCDVSERGHAHVRTNQVDHCVVPEEANHDRGASGQNAAARYDVSDNLSTR